MVVGKVGVCVGCVGNSERLERGVGTSVNDTILSETLLVVGLVEAVGRPKIAVTKDP